MSIKHEYTYKGIAKVKISKSITINYPFTEKIYGKDEEEARAELHTALFNKLIKVHPSLIDLHIEIEGAHLHIII